MRLRRWGGVLLLCLAACGTKNVRIALHYTPSLRSQVSYSPHAVLLKEIVDPRDRPRSAGRVTLDAPLAGWLETSFAAEVITAGYRLHGDPGSLQPGDIVLRLKVLEADCRGWVRSRCTLSLHAQLTIDGKIFLEKDYTTVGRAWNIEGGGAEMFVVGMERALQLMLRDLIADFPGFKPGRR